MSKVIYTDDFSTNRFDRLGTAYFTDATWVPTVPPAQSPYQATVSPGALVVPSTGLEWWGWPFTGAQKPVTPGPLPSSFTSAKVWADVAAVQEVAGMMIEVGFLAGPVFVGAPRPPLIGSTTQGIRAEGVAGGPYVDTTGASMLGVDFNAPGEAAPGSVNRGTALGRVTLTLTPEGAVTVVGPDGTVLTGSVAPTTVESWEAKPVVPYVHVAPGNASATLSAWGYEIDYPPPPSTVQFMGGASGALRR